MASGDYGAWESEAEMMMSGRMKEAGVGDIPVLVELMAAFYEEAGYPLPRGPAARAFESLLGDPTLGRVWLVLESGRAVGYLVLTLSFSMEYGGLRGFVDDFYVRAEARGRGLGAEALREVREACLEGGVRALLVETGPSGHPARRLYARAGFEETGRVFLSQGLAAPLHGADR